jgi:trigger factor
MKTTVEDLSSVKKKLVIEVEAEDVEKRLDKSFRDYGKKAKIKGFRPGKIPRNILENYFGKQIFSEVTESLIKETLPKGLEETKLLPLNIPIIEHEVLKRGMNYHYTAIMEIRPEFQLGEYKGIEVEKETYTVTDQDVSNQLEEIRSAHATLHPIAEGRGIREGDYVVLHYEGFDDNGSIEGIKAQDFSLIIGNKKFFPGVEDALVGLKKGESPTIPVEFDKDYFHSKLAGKKVSFKIHIVDIKEVQLPELNDDFFKQLGEGVKSLDDLNQKIKEELTSREEKRVDKELKERLIEKIAKDVEFELPESLVEAEINSGIESVKQNLIRTGSDLEKSGLDEKKIREEFRPISEKKIKDILILDEIAKQNDLTVSEQDIEEGFKEMSKIMGYDPMTLRKYHETNNMIGSYRQALLKEKALNYLVENATVIEMNAKKMQGASQ